MSTTLLVFQASRSSSTSEKPSNGQSSGPPFQRSSKASLNIAKTTWGVAKNKKHWHPKNLYISLTKSSIVKAWQVAKQPTHVPDGRPQLVTPSGLFTRVVNTRQPRRRTKNMPLFRRVASSPCKREAVWLKTTPNH